MPAPGCLGTNQQPGQCPAICHRSRPIFAAVNSNAAAEIQTPAICHALARGRRPSSMLPLPLAQWGNHPRSQERHPPGAPSLPGRVAHPIPTTTRANRPRAVDNRRPAVHRKDPARPRNPGAPPERSALSARRWTELADGPQWVADSHVSSIPATRITESAH